MHRLTHGVCMDDIQPSIHVFSVLDAFCCILADSPHTDSELQKKRIERNIIVAQGRMNEIRGVDDVELPIQDGKGGDGQGALFAIFWSVSWEYRR